jgi:osomolarity two-component system, sensor histidine kinase SLN1
LIDVTIAKDGQEALDMVRESMETGQRFNLVFMDVQMPNLDGIQSTKRIREIGFSAPIVALTAFAEESNIKDCYDSGMNFFLPKPIRRPELKKVLNKYCPTIHEEEGESGGLASPVSRANGVNSPSRTGSPTGSVSDLAKLATVVQETPKEGANDTKT